FDNSFDGFAVCDLTLDGWTFVATGPCEGTYVIAGAIDDDGHTQVACEGLGPAKTNVYRYRLESSGQFEKLDASPLRIDGMITTDSAILLASRDQTLLSYRLLTKDPITGIPGESARYVRRWDTNAPARLVGIDEDSDERLDWSDEPVGYFAASDRIYAIEP